MLLPAPFGPEEPEDLAGVDVDRDVRQRGDLGAGRERADDDVARSAWSAIRFAGHPRRSGYTGGRPASVDGRRPVGLGAGRASMAPSGPSRLVPSGGGRSSRPWSMVLACRQEKRLVRARPGTPPPARPRDPSGRRPARRGGRPGRGGPPDRVGAGRRVQRAGSRPRRRPPPAPDAAPATITFYGRGYGHGVGMSQYGARGRALAGQDAATILAHYYQGTTPGTTDPKRPIRILVLQAFKPSATKPLKLYGRGGPWTIDGIDASFPKDGLLRVTKTATGFRLVVRDARRGAPPRPGHEGQHPGSRRREGRVADPGLVEAAARTTATAASSGCARRSRASTQSTRPSSTSTCAGSSRSRCRRAGRSRRSGRRRSPPAATPRHRLHPKTGFWDVYDDGRSQAYRGSLAERPATTAAISATAGQVLRQRDVDRQHAVPLDRRRGDRGQRERVHERRLARSSPVRCRTCAGRADRAPDGTAYDAAAPHATWQTAAYTLEQLVGDLRRRPADERRRARAASTCRTSGCRAGSSA